jgi:polyisoprenoid-binding protein YceI
MTMLNLKGCVVSGSLILAFVAAPAFAEKVDAVKKAPSAAKVVEKASVVGKSVRVDSKASVVEWKGSKITGAVHHGTVGIKEGEVQMEGKKLAGGKIVVDMASIVNIDLTDKEYNQKLVGHLKSDDFFDIAKFPTATLLVKSSEIQKDGTYKVKGELTMKSETHPVDFLAKLSADGKSVEADIVFDRTEWNIRYGSGKFFANLGDKVISDKVELKVKLGFAGAVFASK